VKKSSTIFFLLTLFIIIFTFSAYAKFVRVTSEFANIRLMPNTESITISKAFENDIFGYEGEENDWIKINMFSGEHRYIHHNLVKVINYGITATFSNDICQSLTKRLEMAEDRSMVESDNRYPLSNSEDMKKNIEYQRTLLDRYILDIFHEFDLQPVIYQIAITRCIEGSQSKIGQTPTYNLRESKSFQEKVEKSLAVEKKSVLEITNIVHIIKNNAKEKWGNNVKMLNYEVSQQTSAYNWYVLENSYPNILKNAKDKWGNNFVMVKYEYEEQVSAYEWLERYDNYPSILKNAKNKWGNNYVMVNYEYEEQVSAYEWLQKNKNVNPGAFNFASNKWGNNYVMVKYEFEEMCK